ncbi:MAG: hypothetical protein V2I65_14895 [Paracoccaceae bacterium]|nr:hypothetical protein [Paracoccaceae bacterium]
MSSNLSPWLLALCIAAALILRVTSAAEAQGSRQDWLPEALKLPDDMEIVADRQIGSTIRMLKFHTFADAEDLLVMWEDALRSNGYAIGRGQDEPLDGLIEFSGSEIVNAKIIAATRDEDRRSVIEIDATLR